MDDLTYKSSGVDINAGNKAVNMIKPIVKKTFKEGVLTDIGGFGGLFKLNTKKYKEPVLVSGTDGVGTKIKIAFEADIHNTIGIDLVAMCVNDIITSGAEPLFFLDYLAVNKLNPNKISNIISGIAEGCKQADMALIGGETAEMTDIYKNNEYDIAGFAVGVVDKPNIIDGSNICFGDKIIGLWSNGFHSNGYSLIRNVLFKKNKYKIDQQITQFNRSIKDILLAPTKIYYNTIKKISKLVNIKGIAHITGGGFLENINRIIPENLSIKRFDWNIPPIFTWIQGLGNITDSEMHRVFNMGIGMALVLSNSDAKKIIDSVDGVIVGEVIKN